MLSGVGLVALGYPLADLAAVTSRLILLITVHRIPCRVPLEIRCGAATNAIRTAESARSKANRPFLFKARGFESRRTGRLTKCDVRGLLSLGRRHVTEGAEQALTFEPIGPVEGGALDGFGVAPRLVAADDFSHAFARVFRCNSFKAFAHKAP